MDASLANVKLIGGIAALLCCATPALAIPITFTALNFEPQEASSQPPQEIVTGSFDYTLSPTNFFTLNSFDLTIVNKSYTLSDVYVIQEWRPGTITMGSEFTGQGNWGEDDFSFEYDPQGLLGLQFLYTVEAAIGEPLYGAWYTQDIAIEGMSVSEPATALLMLSSVAFLIGLRQLAHTIKSSPNGKLQRDG